MIDRAELANYCAAWSRLSALERAIDEAGISSEMGWRLMIAADRAAARVSRTAALFGFSPAARTRIKGDSEGGKAPEEEAGKSRFFRAG